MEISLEPYSRLSVRSYLEFDSPEQLASTMGAGTSPSVTAQGTLRWANGVVFVVYAFQPSDSIAEEYIQKHLLWDHVDFALMPQFQKELHPPDKPLLTFTLVDLSNHSVYGPFANWIRETLAGKNRAEMRRKVTP